MRNKYLLRNQDEDFTFHNVILAGVHDVKTLKLEIRPDCDQKPFYYAQDKYNSPWNIATEFKIDMSFNPLEISTMLLDYSRSKPVKMNVPDIAAKLHFYTSGYPFLVSKLCKVFDEEILPQKTKPTLTEGDIDEAFRLTLKDSNTNFDSLIKNIENDPDLYDLIRQIIIDGEVISFIPTDPVISIAITHGIFREEKGKCKVHNRIYEHLLYDHMMMRIVRENRIKKTSDYNFIDNFITGQKGLDFEKVVLKFQLFMKEQFSKKDSKFIEANGRLLFLAFLKPIINGYGFDFKEVQISEERRLDIVVTFLNKKYVVELKVWRGDAYHRKGLKQLAGYLEKQNMDNGFLIIFDFSKNKECLPAGQAGKQDRMVIEKKDIFMVWV